MTHLHSGIDCNGNYIKTEKKQVNVFYKFDKWNFCGYKIYHALAVSHAEYSEMTETLIRQVYRSSHSETET